MDKEGILRGLAARLELDADLGLDYVSGQIGITKLLRGVVDNVNRTSVAKANFSPETKSAAPATRFFEKKAAPVPAPASVSIASRSTTAVRVSLVPYVESPERPEQEAALAELRDECMVCDGCFLCQKRTTVVWGEGDLNADVMFIGEGPGRDEDLEGRPFVGRSGRVLTDIIEKGMGVPRSHVYITNVVKCRPPGNRDPRPDEVHACSRYLSAQMRVIKPKVIVAVGSVAGRSLLGVGEGSPGLRGRWHDYGGVPLRIIYHPSYLLRMRRDDRDRTDADRITWKDIKEVMARIGG